MFIIVTVDIFGKIEVWKNLDDILMIEKKLVWNIKDIIDSFSDRI